MAFMFFDVVEDLHVMKSGKWIVDVECVYGGK